MLATMLRCVSMAPFGYSGGAARVLQESEVLVVQVRLFKL